MHSNFLFKADELITFQRAIKKHCDEMEYHHLTLTEDEIEQLSWYVGDQKVSPESRNESSYELHFEIKRALNRRYGFELLLRGTERAYHEFVQAQNDENKLSFYDFEKLSTEANLLDADIKAAILASCFFISANAKEKLKHIGQVFSADTEELFSQCAQLAVNDRTLLPITQNLSSDQLKLLQKMYWPNMHLRQMSSTEGSDNMTQSLRAAIAAKQFDERDFTAWKWRWLTNFFGFNVGKGAKFYNQDTHMVTTLALEELKKFFSDPNALPFLDHYLQKRLNLAGLNDEKLNLTQKEQEFLAHLVCFCLQTPIIKPELAKFVYEGFKAYQEKSNDSGSLADQYARFRKDESVVTPTYTPAIMNNSFLIFRDQMHLDAGESLKYATQFTCEFLSALYCLPYHKRISCMNVSKSENLLPILKTWYLDHKEIQFNLNEKDEVEACEKPELKNVLMM